ncbi:unknown [Crocosphaera subtropica ATCC 51142]|uniref:Chromosome partition protein Smc n=1 Tax=Crocosphaera subtropica (strain ATCC 51142 / BH68) TaxID=43989 RepID=B1WNF8_CROS5|nr:unknown [Crocosphaera subtropica ATCC 51142]
MWLVLYLAEVKKQTRGFIGGSRTEIKLLACQHNDQTWSSVPGEEVVALEELEQLGEGTLLMVNLGNNRQVQGEPELAAPELVRQLQKLSRLSEKLKTQQEEIEQWKQSLQYQSQELTRREAEMEARLEQLEEIEKELSQIERRRQEADSAWNRVEQTQQQFQDFQRRFGPVLELPGAEAEKMQELIVRLAQSSTGLESLEKPFRAAINASEAQQEILNQFWQQLDTLKAEVQRQTRQVQQQGEILENRFQALEETQTSLEEAKIQWGVQQNILSNKQDRLQKVNDNLRVIQELQHTLEQVAGGVGDMVSETKVDVVSLEDMPLGELEEKVKSLQGDLDKLVRFVNDQEEELTLQCQTVQELQDKLAEAGDFERLDLESELAEEQERKQFLDETLVGQRRNLKERQEVLLQYLRVLRRRQGVIDFDSNTPAVNIDPVLIQLEEWENRTTEERETLETEIHHLHNSVQEIQTMIKQLDTEQVQKIKQLEGERENWQQAQIEVAQLQVRLDIYENSLKPLQRELDETKHQLGILGEWLNPS